MMAAIVPTPRGTADCIYCPRLFTERTASSNDKAPAQTNAEYSPKL